MVKRKPKTPVTTNLQLRLIVEHSYEQQAAQQEWSEQKRNWRVHMLLWVLYRGCPPDVRGGHCVVLKDNNALGTQMQLGVWSKEDNSCWLG